MAFPPPTGPEDERTELIDFMGTKYPFKVAVPPPERFDPAKARADTAALATGSLTPGLEPGTWAATVSTRALDELALGIRPDQVLKDWQAGLPERGAPPAKPGTAAGLAERMGASMTPLLEGVRGLLTRQVAAQRGHEDKLAAVAWLNGCARLAAAAPPALAADSAARLGAALGDPGMGKIFLDKVAYYQVLGELERDAGRDLAADPRLAGVSPEIREDLEADRRRLAREQGLNRQVAAARGRAAFSRGLAGAFTAARQGEAGPAYAREQFLELYGAREGESRWQAYQASQAKAPAYALVRGRSQEEIAAAKAGYGGDQALLAQVEAEDAAERRRDPAGYGLAWAPGARAAYDQAGDPGEQAAILWEAQAAAGIPETERSPWSGEQATALAEGWLAIQDGPGAARARVDLLRQGLLSLLPEQRAAGQATLVRMLAGGTAPVPLGSIVAALEDNRLGDAYAAAATTQPTAKDTPDLIQLADSGQIASDAGPEPGPVESKLTGQDADAADTDIVDALLRQRDETAADWSLRLGNALYDLTPMQQVAVYESLMDALGVPPDGIRWPARSEEEADLLLQMQNVVPNAHLRATPLNERDQDAFATADAFDQQAMLHGALAGAFVGPDGRLYWREAALSDPAGLGTVAQDYEEEIWRQINIAAAESGDVGTLIGNNPGLLAGAPAFGMALFGALRGKPPGRSRSKGETSGRSALPQPLGRQSPEYQAFFGSQKGMTLEQRLATAPKLQEELAAAGEQIARGLGVTFKNPGVKQRGRIAEKMEAWAIGAGEMEDLVRGGFVARTPKDADAIVAELAKRYPALDRGWVSINGYVERRVNVRLSDGSIGEVQIWSPAMARTKIGEGVTLYNRFRSAEPRSPQQYEARQKLRAFNDAIRREDEAEWQELYSGLGLR